MRRSAENVMIAGPAGQLEGIVEFGEGRAPQAVAVICHPHPLHGGTMDNKVVHTLSRAFLGISFRTLRFNFRGAGSSEGAYDEGRGEIQDALAATEWLRRRNPGLPLWLAGFSFGAAIAIRATVASEPAGLITVAPPAARLSGKLSPQPSCPWLIVHGDRDEVVDIDETLQWVNELEPGPELTIFPETTHFFHGKLVALREAVQDFVRDNSG